ncbi:MAG: response regulator, partial [Steroidobacteraceae bacterium]
MTSTTAPPPIAIIADDEETGRLLLAESAEQVGLAPLMFDNGTEALEAALAHGTAIVLLDVEMPGLDGYTVCRRLRGEPRFTTTPIVMV